MWDSRQWLRLEHRCFDGADNIWCRDGPDLKELLIHRILGILHRVF